MEYTKDMIDPMFMEIDGNRVDAIAEQKCPECKSKGFQFLVVRWGGIPFPLYPPCPMCGAMNVVMRKDMIWRRSGVKVQ